MKPPLRLALIWHFHQPDYTDPVSGAPSMPWTRLHALKDYVDMVEHVLRHRKVRVTFNGQANADPIALSIGEIRLDGKLETDAFREIESCVIGPEVHDLQQKLRDEIVGEPGFLQGSRRLGV